MKKVFAVSLRCPSLESQFAMINCTVIKMLGDFNIAKNPSIITKSFCSGTDAGLGKIESITRIKEHPS